MFSMSVLVGLVVTIYVVFPARHGVLLTEAIERHRSPPVWDLAAPTPDELRFWALGAVGKDVPLPPPMLAIVGARRLDILNREAALVRVRVGSDEVSYLVQHARGIAAEDAARTDGDLQATAWHRGKFACVAVGPAATAATWLP